MKIEELFKDSIPEIPENSADNANVFSDEIRERIYSRIRSKLDSEQNECSKTGSVSGVEKYKRPVLTRFLGISAAVAAAAVIAVGSLSVYEKRNTVSNQKESVLNSLSYSDHAAVADMLTDEFIAASDYLNGEVITSGSGIHFYEYSSRAPEWRGEDVLYYKIDDVRFGSISEIYDTLRGSVSDEYFTVLKDNGGTFIGRSIDEAIDGEDNVTSPVLVEFGNSLYTTQENNAGSSEKRTVPQILEEDKYSFSACIDTDEEYVFGFVWDGKQWKIDNVSTD